MNVMLWDIKKEIYVEMNNVKRIYQSVGKDYFAIDGKHYSTDKYDLQFINIE